MLRKSFKLVLSLAVSLSAFGTAALLADDEISVAAAANLQYVLPEINKAFESANQGVKVKAVFGSSGNFTSQIMNKAPFDIFISADTSYPQKVIDAGLAKKDSFCIYAVGKLAIWVSESSKINVEGQGLRSVLDPSVSKIAMANPKLAPYGRAAEAALRGAGIYDQVKDKLVLGENIGQVAQFVQSGSADIGFIAESLAYGPGMKGRLWPIPVDSYPKIEQALVILGDAKNPELVEKYRQFVIGPDGSAILKRFGFDIPSK